MFRGRFGIAIFVDPQPTGGKSVIAQHVYHGPLTYHSPKEVWPLQHARRHQHAAVAAASDRKVGCAGIAVGNEPLGSGDIVIKDVLLLLQHPRLMPGFPIFATATQTGDSINPALFEPDAGCNGKKRW